MWALFASRDDPGAFGGPATAWTARALLTLPTRPHTTITVPAQRLGGFEPSSHARCAGGGFAQRHAPGVAGGARRFARRAEFSRGARGAGGLRGVQLVAIGAQVALRNGSSRHPHVHVVAVLPRAAGNLLRRVEVHVDPHLGAVVARRATKTILGPAGACGRPPTGGA